MKPWVKVVLNVLGAAAAGYVSTEDVAGVLAAVGSALVALFQKRPQGNDGGG